MTGVFLFFIIVVAADADAISIISSKYYNFTEIQCFDFLKVTMIISQYHGIGKWKLGHKFSLKLYF